MPRPDATLVKLAVLLSAGMVAMMFIPPLRRFYEFEVLTFEQYLVVAGAVAVWGAALLAFWRSRLLSFMHKAGEEVAERLEENEPVEAGRSG